jgi:hypothetical protein
VQLEGPARGAFFLDHQAGNPQQNGRHERMHLTLTGAALWLLIRIRPAA